MTVFFKVKSKVENVKIKILCNITFYLFTIMTVKKKLKNASFFRKISAFFRQEERSLRFAVTFSCLIVEAVFLMPDE